METKRILVEKIGIYIFMKPQLWKGYTLDALIIVFIASLITVLSFLMKSFWGDEILSITFSSGPVGSVLSSVASDYHPPLYFLCLNLWITLFGTGEGILRLFQGLQGAVFLLLSLIMFRKIFPSVRYHPFWILLSFSSEFWLFMPMVRYYIFTANLVLLSSIVFLNWLKNPDFKTSACLFLTYIGILYSDYPSAIVLLAQGVMVFWKYRSLLKTMLALFALSILAFIPWVMIVLNQIHHLVMTQHDADLNSSPVAVIIKIAFSVYAFIFGETLYPFEPVAVVGILFFIILFGRIIIKKEFPENKNLLYVVIVMAMGILFTSFVTTYIASRTSFIYTPSRTLFALPFYFLFGGMIYSSISSRWVQRFLFVGILAINLSGDVHWLENRHFIMPVYASPWKDVLGDLQGIRGIVISDESLCYEYYRQHSECDFPALQKPRTVIDLKKMVHDSSVTLILVGRESTNSEVNQEIIDYLKDNAKLLATTKYLPIDKDYQDFKSRFIHRQSYDAKITVFHYELQD